MNNSIFFFFYNLNHIFPFTIVFAVYFPYLVTLTAFIFLLFHHEVLPAHNPIAEFKKKWKGVALVFFSGALAWVMAHILKILIHTDRPFIALPNVHALFPETGFSFPSGHATFFMALAFSIFFINKKIGYVFMFFALIIGLARIAGGVHFPIDILGGFILGALVAYFVKNV